MAQEPELRCCYRLYVYVIYYHRIVFVLMYSRKRKRTYPRRSGYRKRMSMVPYSRKPYYAANKSGQSTKSKKKFPLLNILKKGAMLAMKFLNSEMKQFYLHEGPDSIGNTIAYYRLNPLVQDVSVDGRVGNSVLIKSFSLRLELIHNASATNINVRVAVINYKPCDKEDLTAGDKAWDNTFKYQSLISMRVLNYTSQIDVLYDKRFHLDTYHPYEFDDRYMDLDIHCDYDGATGNYDNQVSNCLMLMTYCDENTNKPTLVFDSAIRYTDN